jgi:hypothetical protein
MSRAILPRQAKPVAAPEAPKHDSDPYAKFLNHRIEVLLHDGARVVGILTNASPYALLLETPSGPTIINKAFLVSVVKIE